MLYILAISVVRVPVVSVHELMLLINYNRALNYLLFYCNFVVFDAVHGPKLTEEVLSHCAFQKELSEMLDKPVILKHLKQQV